MSSAENPIARAHFIGSIESVDLWVLLETIGVYRAGSTVSSETILSHGYQLPNR